MPLAMQSQFGDLQASVCILAAASYPLLSNPLNLTLLAFAFLNVLLLRSSLLVGRHVERKCGVKGGYSYD